MTHIHTTGANHCTVGWGWNDDWVVTAIRGEGREDQRLEPRAGVFLWGKAIENIDYLRIRRTACLSPLRLCITAANNNTFCVKPL